MSNYRGEVVAPAVTAGMFYGFGVEGGNPEPWNWGEFAAAGISMFIFYAVITTLMNASLNMVKNGKGRNKQT